MNYFKLLKQSKQFCKKLQNVGKKTRKTNTSETDSVKLTQIREEIFVQHLFRPIDKTVGWMYMKNTLIMSKHNQDYHLKILFVM